MEWIKTRYDRFLLLLAAIILIAVSVLIILKALSFGGQFALSPETGGAKIPQPDIDAVSKARARLGNPAKWPSDPNQGHLLVSRAYIESNGVLVDPTDPNSPKIHPPVDNNWILNNDLPIKDPTVLQQDPDQDGFENVLEFGANTDPNDAKAHPEYVTKLFLAGIKENPFNLKFSAITSQGVYQIDATNSGEPTQFLSVNDTIAGSDFQLTAFKEILEPQPNGTNKDKSEITIVNKKGETVTLVLGVKLNVGNNDAIFTYRWKGEEQIARRKDQTFSLKPEASVQYSVKEITPQEVKIARVSDGKEYLIKKP